MRKPAICLLLLLTSCVGPVVMGTMKEMPLVVNCVLPPGNG